MARVVRDCVAALWDHLGLMAAISLTCAALFCVPLGASRLLPESMPPAIRVAIVLLVTALVLSAPLAGACHAGRLCLKREEVAYTDFWAGAARFAGAATIIGLIDVMIPVALGSSAWVYLGMGAWPGLLGAALCVYAFLAWALMAVYHIPALVAEDLFPPSTASPCFAASQALRRSFYLTLADPLAAVRLLCILVICAAFTLATGVLAPLIGVATWAVISTSALIAELMRLRVVPPPVIEPVVPDEQFRLPDPIVPREGS